MKRVNLANEFRYRGVEVEVDTTIAAEFDVKGFQIPDARMDEIARHLKAVTFSDHDLVHGALRFRRFDGYEILFTVGREDGRVVITIGGVQPVEEGLSFDDIVSTIDAVGTWKGRLGL